MNEIDQAVHWQRDFDHTTDHWAAHAPEIWDDLRQSCPVARSDAFGGTWLPTRHDDISAIAHDTENYTSQGVLVSPFRPDVPAPMGPAPPITSDPPFHAIARRLLLPPFAPKPIKALEPYTREFCHRLIDDLLEGGRRDVDAAAEYAQHIPVRIIAKMLGVPESDGELFRGFIHRIIEAPGEDHHVEYEDTIDYYLDTQIAQHRANPRADDDGDLIDYLINADIEGQQLSDEHVRGSIALLLIAGIDTTWSAIGASLWHLAQRPDQRRLLRDQPELMPFAIEELLRFYAPVTMARISATDHELGGCPVKAGDWMLLPFPAANRDPDAFDDAHDVILDRKANRHAAFGLGIHRCLGSNLARLELTVAVEIWLARVPEFELIHPDATRWSAGQIRGPRELPVRILEASKP
ncbi:MAG: cytochrome P450 [Acidimicrobiia bacterium]